MESFKISCAPDSLRAKMFLVQDSSWAQRMFKQNKWIWELPDQLHKHSLYFKVGKEICLRYDFGDVATIVRNIAADKHAIV